MTSLIREGPAQAKLTHRHREHAAAALVMYKHNCFIEGRPCLSDNINRCMLVHKGGYIYTVVVVLCMIVRRLIACVPVALCMPFRLDIKSGLEPQRRGQTSVVGVGLSRPC